MQTPRGWSSFDEETKTLFQKLMQGAWGVERPVELTYAEMRLFKAAHQLTER